MSNKAISVTFLYKKNEITDFNYSEISTYKINEITDFNYSEISTYKNGNQIG